MKKSIIAIITAAITVGAVGSGVATFSASQSDTKLQIAGESGETVLQEKEGQDVSGEASPDKEDAKARSEEAVQSVTEVAASLPTGDITRTELVNAESTSMIADIAENVMPAMVSIRRGKKFLRVRGSLTSSSSRFSSTEPAACTPDRSTNSA